MGADWDLSQEISALMERARRTASDEERSADNARRPDHERDER